MKLSYKKLHQDHLKITYRWINLKSVRQNSIKKKKISLKDHKKWLTKSIKSKINFIRIIYKDQTPIGIIRFEKKQKIYLISYLIDRKFRMKGYAFKSLKYLINNFSKKNKFKMHAYALIKNLPSKRIFEKLGFSIYKTYKKYIIYHN
jgi:RimJ/RimL family protein N-acetyltransferase